MEKGSSEFDAPVYSTVNLERIGTKLVRMVIFDGELMTFEVDRGVHAAGKALEDKASNTSEEK